MTKKGIWIFCRKIQLEYSGIDRTPHADGYSDNNNIKRRFAKKAKGLSGAKKARTEYHGVRTAQGDETKVLLFTVLIKIWKSVRDE